MCKARYCLAFHAIRRVEIIFRRVVANETTCSFFIRKRGVNQKKVYLCGRETQK